MTELAHQRAEPAAVLGGVDGVRRVPQIGTPAASSRRASFSGVWPPSCTSTPTGCSRTADLEHVLEGQRLEVQPVGGVVVGRDRLGVAVDHDGLVAGVAQREHGVDAAVVELDALPDAVRPGAEDDDLVGGRRSRTSSSSS
jgi:hypothetical protein